MCQWRQLRAGWASDRNHRVVKARALATILIFVSQPLATPASWHGQGRIDFIDVEGAKGARRQLLVAVPPNFAQASPNDVQVVYMLDGEGLFATRLGEDGWGAEASLWPLIEKGCAPSTLIVGVIAGKTRSLDYTPSKRLLLGGGELQAFEADLTGRVMPTIAARYGVKADAAHTAIVGASYGGLAALHIGLGNPRLFGTIGAFSPSLWWSRRATDKLIGGARVASPKPRIWLSVGQKERIPALAFVIDPVANARAAGAELQASGWPPPQWLQVTIYPDGRHNDASWRRQLPDFWRWSSRAECRS